MRYIKILLRVLVVALAVAVFDYTLPSTDIVRVVGTEVVRTDLSSGSFFWASPDTGTGTDQQTGNRDVRFINTVFEDGEARVYRNEDTGWSWPPYFKFDSGNLHAEAQNASIDQSWVAVRHYGWRMEFLSIYPNALSMRVVDGPDAGSFNWIRIVAAILLALFGVVVWRVWVWLRNWLADVTDRVKARF